MIVLVSGSRTWTDYQHVFSKLYASYPPVTEFLVGDAPSGLDRIVMRLFRSEDGSPGDFMDFYEHEPTVYEADWERYRPKAGQIKEPRRNPAGMIRNDEMLDRPPDHVVCFWDGESHGTKHVIDGAIKRGIPLDVYVRPVGVRLRP